MLFAEQTVHLSLRREGPVLPPVTSDHLAPPTKHSQEVRSKHHRAKSSSGALIRRKRTVEHTHVHVDGVIIGH